MVAVVAPRALVLGEGTTLGVLLHSMRRLGLWRRGGGAALTVRVPTTQVLTASLYALGGRLLLVLRALVSV